ncbi:phage head-tail joining protein [Bradyrhizobium sp. S3.7.6]
MAFSQAQLDAIEEAIAAGSTSVSYEGKSVTYRSLDEMLRIRSIIRSALGLTTQRPTVLVEHSRGYRDQIGNK